MTREDVEVESDRVVVQIRSKRGSGTRDQDEVTVRGVYEDVEEAERESPRLNQLLEERMRDARKLGADGRSDRGAGPRTEPDPEEASKVYLGDGAETEGWVPVEKDVIEEEIVPLVEKYETDREDIETIAVNFSNDVSASGWNHVDAGIVTRTIEPIVQEHRRDVP